MSAKKPGWFSRRYQTSEAHEAAQARKQEREEFFWASIAEREEARRNRSDQEQLKLLDKRLGKGKGAKRERARLASLIAKTK